MIAAASFKGRTVAVFGLARSGLAAVRALVEGGASVLAWDDRETARQAARDLGATARFWGDWPWDDVAALILSPGVPLHFPEPHDVVVRARECGIEVIGDIELFAREMHPAANEAGRAPVIAITGTNGKSTTTALIGHILKACGFDAQVGGNIGVPALELAPPGPKTVYVLEVSSYQIDLSPSLHADVAVLTNISPDHIDRHGSLDNYIEAKGRLLRQAAEDGTSVVGVDDEASAGLFTAQVAAGRRASPVAVGKILGRGLFVLDGALFDAQSTNTAKLADLRGASHLPGAHNWQNAALAYAATRTLVKSGRAIAEAISDFPGLAHRIETVGRMGALRFVNDSKATNADAAAKALACFDDIFWIAGGRAKSDGIGSLAPFFPRIRKAYLIGEAAEAFARTLQGALDFEISATLDVAVASAARDGAAAQGNAPVVLLSPACASFDQFADFEARGEAFRVLARGVCDGMKEAS